MGLPPLAHSRIHTLTPPSSPPPQPFACGGQIRKIKALQQKIAQVEVQAAIRQVHAKLLEIKIRQVRSTRVPFVSWDRLDVLLVGRFFFSFFLCFCNLYTYG